MSVLHFDAVNKYKIITLGSYSFLAFHLWEAYIMLPTIFHTDLTILKVSNNQSKKALKSNWGLKTHPITLYTQS